MTLLVTAAEMRRIEAEAVSRGETWQGLMERAGAEVARHAIRWLGPETRQRVLALAGPGNNGGDALVVARQVADHGWAVRVLTWSRRGEGDEWLREPLKQLGVPVLTLTEDNFEETLSDALGWATVVVDGLLGTGLQREVEGGLARVIERVAASRLPVIAVDIPTGVDSDTGAVLGAALPARFTVTLGHMKYGHVLHPGKDLSGDIAIGDIELDTQVSRETASGELLTDQTIAAMLPERPADAHKGTFGKVMVVAGSVNYIGAAALATEGAMRAGAGLVTLGCAGDLLPMLASKLTECTFLPLPSDLGVIASPAAEKVRSSVEGYDALLVGCGLGKDKETAQFLRWLLPHQEPTHRAATRYIGFATRLQTTEPPKEEKGDSLPPLVLDGDALNILSEWEEWPHSVPEGSVLTPHPGEMARLLGSTVEEVQRDRVHVARESAGRWKQVVVFKGAATVIADPEGKVYVSPFSNPALATAGTGDVLAGTIAGMMAQGLSPVRAACVGVYLHGMAGEMLREQYGPAGGLAGDLPVLLARAQRRLRDGR